MNYNERTLPNCAFCRIPTDVVVISTILTFKTKFFKFDYELTAGSFDDVEDVCDEESMVDLTNLVDSEDDLSDDESLSFEYDEFMDKDLWIAGQEMHRRHLRTALSLQSLEDEGGLMPDHPDRNERTKHLANSS